MEFKNKFDFALKRRKLFKSAGAGMAIYVMNKIFPFRLTGSKKHNPGKTDIIVKINPNAVNRNNTGKNNV